MKAENDWIHYNIYTGKLEKMDSVIENILFPLIENIQLEIDVKKWFFMRYIDQEGPHLRFRLLVPSTMWKKTIVFMEEESDSIITHIKEMPDINMQRLLPVGSHTDFPSGVKIELGLYDPEVKKYGGQLGLEYAEDLFQASTKLVGNFISQINEIKVDRFELALNIMKWTVESSSLSQQELYTFIYEYVLYWGDSGYGQSNMTTHLLKQAENKSDYIEKVFANGNQFSNNPYMKDYLERLQNLLKLAKDSEDIQQTERSLLFHYLHMMNNRIGVWPIEEAYLAALLSIWFKDNQKRVNINEDTEYVY